ncbi:hypothetical protein E2C01_038028 [Portunus trituberculatus]|uniref:Uncharacterized protein n=1 Tax=Portunus trituberculatus TaxID=210409 RepID=A0A5B7FG66_PORTR|nr:hypothetical protein [Portunus trituberculatus]
MVVFRDGGGKGKMVARRGGAGQRAAGSRLEAAAKTSRGVLGSPAERLTTCRLPPLRLPTPPTAMFLLQNCEAAFPSM